MISLNEKFWNHILEYSSHRLEDMQTNTLQVEYQSCLQVVLHY